VGLRQPGADAIRGGRGQEMKLDEPIYIERVDSERPQLVWVNPCVTPMQLEQLPIVKIDDTDQLLVIYGKLNMMRMDAEERAREAERREEESWHEVQRLKARIRYLKCGME